MIYVLATVVTLVGVSLAKPAGLYLKPNMYYSNAVAPPLQHAVKSQFHTQDELGQYSYGYSDGLSSKTESKSLNGITHGSYSYLDSNGIVQNVNYVADDVNGFRVAASNLPVGPAPVGTSPAAIPVPAGAAGIAASPPASAIVQADPLQQPEPIYAPVQPVVGDYPGSPVHQYPAYPFVPNPHFNEFRPAYDANVSPDEDSVSVAASKLYADVPQPVQDTPEVAAAKQQHMAMYAQVQQQQALSGGVVSAESEHGHDGSYDDSDSDSSNSIAVSAVHSSGQVAPVHTVAAIPTAPLKYPFAPYQVQPTGNIISQYHSQDELGQYSYGYSGGPSSKSEVKTLDGITRGSYSYIDANGEIQHVNYISDPANGFRVAASNLPVAPTA